MIKCPISSQANLVEMSLSQVYTSSRLEKRGKKAMNARLQPYLQVLKTSLFTSMSEEHTKHFWADSNLNLSIQSIPATHKFTSKKMVNEVGVLFPEILQPPERWRLQ